MKRNGKFVPNNGKFVAFGPKNDVLLGQTHQKCFSNAEQEYPFFVLAFGSAPKGLSRGQARNTPYFF
jgi:hypothetical protein